MNILFFDCETTGKPISYSASYTDVNNWPRVTQLAFCLCDDAGNVIAQFQSLIKPDGWVVPKEQFFIDNNMSTERCEAEGIPIREALEQLMAAKLQADVLSAHNLNFDHRIVWAEFVRAEMPPRSGMHKICTMMQSTRHCNLPGKRGPKWPTLGELHNVLFKKDFDGAHDALADVLALKDCFFELLNLGVISLPAPVDNPPAPAPITEPEKLDFK
ncbi:MAG: 3'-5' exonuclease [Ferruginibacter sp.]